MHRPRIVINTAGSLGDLHPYVAIALALRERGADPVLATHGMYRARLETLGLGFHEVPPDLADFGDLAETMKIAMDRMKGSEYVVRKLVLPYLAPTYAALEAACRDADLLVTHPLSFAARILAEKRRLKWVGTALQPLGMFSTHDPSVLPFLPVTRHLRWMGPGVHGMLRKLAIVATRSWGKPVNEFRRSLGLLPSSQHPFLEGQFSTHGNLILFSRVLAPPQPDWPRVHVQTGFAFYDADEGGRRLDPELARFLDAGEPPFVFTLGSAAVMDPRGFFLESARAAQMLGERAVLLVGPESRTREGLPADAKLLVAAYAPFSELFPRAAVNVHQGGIGTTGQAMAAGRPMLVMPCAHDQPDNGYRCERLGIGLVIGRDQYHASRVAPLLDRLVREPSFAARAGEVAREVHAEPGAAGAAQQLMHFAAE